MIDYNKYLRTGEGTPVINTIISKIDDVDDPLVYPPGDNYHNITKVLGEHDNLVEMTDRVAPSPSYTDLEPMYDSGTEKFLIPQHKSYGEKDLLEPLIGERDHLYPHPECYVLRLGDSYVLIFLEDKYPISRLTTFDHEYLFLKDEDSWKLTRLEKHIKKAANIAVTALSLQDDPNITYKLPF